MSELTAARLRELLHYDPETGEFRRNCTRASYKAGRLAGSMKRGYVVITISDKHYMAHRLAWLYMTGAWPTQEVDHIDRVKSNNAWKNLREVTPSVNQYNIVAPQPQKKLPVRGVYETPHGFMACVTVDRKQKFLGRFRTIEEAQAAYIKAKKQACPEAVLVP